MRSSTNYLLQKDDIGKPKPSTHKLPSIDHVFGLENRVDPVGVGGCKFYFSFLSSDIE